MGERLRVALSCSECGARNYQTTKSREKSSVRLEIKKFCPTCARHTLHKETK
jgi:large subunit ribosomal protein L33